MPANTEWQSLDLNFIPLFSFYLNNCASCGLRNMYLHLPIVTGIVWLHIFYSFAFFAFSGKYNLSKQVPEGTKMHPKFCKDLRKWFWKKDCERKIVKVFESCFGEISDWFWSFSVIFARLKKTHYRPTDGPTDRRADWRTDGRTDGRTNPLIEMRGRI